MDLHIIRTLVVILATYKKQPNKYLYLLMLPNLRMFSVIFIYSLLVLSS